MNYDLVFILGTDGIKGSNDPVLVMIATTYRLHILHEQLDCNREAMLAEPAEGSPGDMHARQLQCLNMGAQILEEAVSSKSVPGVVESRQELFLSLKRFKACLSYIIGGSSMKGNLQKVQGKKWSKLAKEPGSS